jgi:hypothetical protein
LEPLAARQPLDAVSVITCGIMAYGTETMNRSATIRIVSSANPNTPARKEVEITQSEKA